MARISVLGAGAFGTALAAAIGADGTPVSLWCRDPELARDINTDHENRRRLPDRILPESVVATPDIDDALGDAEIVLLAVPMQTLRPFVQSHCERLSHRTLVTCCKGIDFETEEGPVEILASFVPDAKRAILSGPSFAADIALGLPTALTIAAADDDLAAHLQSALSTRSLRLYRTTDTMGVELGGALKNVIAIACGACIGEGFGDSARAALMTRGFAEMQRLAAHRGARPETLTGLSGLGDLALTCGSEQSRNYRFGLALGRQEPFDASVTVEGVATAKAVARYAAHEALEMPITRAVAEVSDGGTSVAEALRALLSRPLKKE
ncbi:NAD(P)H-dependent glycerol-3-phosphate dehydrogenase [Celeribacter arenosi]|uniref:Glycerol-3-phosphate dehydrogenase [NAD(P)+] n=1 Tax=Celeribacter arenosi TaxID=792649 RepID=A0ABP7JYM5_9RHOB